MKARIVPRKEIVLLYRHNEAENGEKLIDLFKQMKLEYRLVEEKDLNKTTGELSAVAGDGVGRIVGQPIGSSAYRNEPRKN